jgi:hypothetical protein
VLARSQGSVQLLPNRNAFVGWGTIPTFSEYSPAGKQLFSGSYRSPIQSYRAYRFPWTGHPPWAPAIAVRRTTATNQFDVYASWNGATQVRWWRVLGGSSNTGPFTKLKTVPWSSFEASTTVSTGDAYFEVQALRHGRKLLPNGTSAVVAAP